MAQVRMGDVVVGLGLGAVGALHLAWGMGSAFPASSRTELAELVVGGDQVPGPVPCAAVGAAALAASTVVLAGGDSRLAQLGRQGVCAVLGARAVIPESAVFELTGLPEPGERFRRLDRRYYRPLCAVLSLAAGFSVVGHHRQRS